MSDLETVVKHDQPSNWSENSCKVMWKWGEKSRFKMCL